MDRLKGVKEYRNALAGRPDLIEDGQIDALTLLTWFDWLIAEVERLQQAGLKQCGELAKAQRECEQLKAKLKER